MTDQNAIAMPGHLTYDVFLSHSSKDKAVVRDVAERLRKAGLQLWFDEWELAKAKGGKRQSISELQPFLNAPIKSSLAQILYINWLPAKRKPTLARPQGCYAN